MCGLKLGLNHQSCFMHVVYDTSEYHLAACKWFPCVISFKLSCFS